MTYFGLLDCNNFFVSCERLFRPDLTGKPVAVMSSNDGCIVARSNEVKALGIPMGAPVFKVRDELTEHQVTLFSSNFTLYRDISRRVMEVLEAEVGTIQPYSIDEAFFDLASTRDEGEIKRLKCTIERSVGVPVTIGVGKTKTIAKAASEIGKKESGIKILVDDDWKQVQRDMHIGSIWGVGRQTSAKCVNLGITTVADYVAADPAQIKQLFGIGGARLYSELQQVPVTNIETSRERKKSIMSTRSFRATTEDKRVLKDALKHHVAHVAEELRADSLLATYLSVSIRPSRHGDFALRDARADITLPVPSNDTRLFYAEMSKALDAIYEPGVPYKKAGVVAGGFVDTEAVTTSLFAENEGAGTATDSGVMDVVDEINQSLGAGSVLLGQIETASLPWHSKHESVSPKYTTAWSDIPCIRL